MRTALRLVALGIALVGLVFWFFGGPHLGWTRTSVPITKTDPVTELEYVEWQSNFVPGVDFLAATMLAAGGVLVASWLTKARQSHSDGNPAKTRQNED